MTAFGGPFDLDRLLTVITFGGGLGLFLVAITALLRAETPALSSAAGRTARDSDTAASPTA